MTPATGRPGVAVAPLNVPQGKGAVTAQSAAETNTGYDPDLLDGPLRAAIAVTNKHVAIAESLADKVTEALAGLASYRLDTPEDRIQALAQADAMVTMHEKMARSGAQLVKAIDELSRLRSFIAGGPDSRPDLSSKGEKELMTMLKAAADGLGLQLVPKSSVVDVEASP